MCTGDWAKEPSWGLRLAPSFSPLHHTLVIEMMTTVLLKTRSPAEALDISLSSCADLSMKLPWIDTSIL